MRPIGLLELPLHHQTGIPKKDLDIYSPGCGVREIREVPAGHVDHVLVDLIEEHRVAWPSVGQKGPGTQPDHPDPQRPVECSEPEWQARATLGVFGKGKTHSRVLAVIGGGVRAADRVGELHTVQSGAVKQLAGAIRFSYPKHPVERTLFSDQLIAIRGDIVPQEPPENRDHTKPDGRHDPDGRALQPAPGANRRTARQEKRHHHA